MTTKGIRHLDIGTELTRVEWEAEDSHFIASGTGYPSTPAEMDLFYRTDEHKWYIYTGSGWTELTGGGGYDGGDLIPNSANDHTIGSATYEFQGIYVGSNGIYYGTSQSVITKELSSGILGVYDSGGSNLGHIAANQLQGLSLRPYTGNNIDYYTATTDSYYNRFLAWDDDIDTHVEIARVANASNPYFSFGGSQQFKFYYGGGMSQKAYGASHMYFYPNVISMNYDATKTGAWIINTPVSRTANVMFIMHVTGYFYNSVKTLNFWVTGYSTEYTTGNLDSETGGVSNYVLNDIGNDGLAKYVGIDGTSNTLCIAIGDVDTEQYYGRLTVDFYNTQNSTMYETGWTTTWSTTTDFGWGDKKTLSSTHNGTTFVGDIGIGANSLTTTDIQLYQYSSGWLSIENLVGGTWKSLYTYGIGLEGGGINDFTGSGFIVTQQVDSKYFVFNAMDNDTDAVTEVGRMVNATDPYFALGGTYDSRFYNSGRIELLAHTSDLVAGIESTATGTATRGTYIGALFNSSRAWQDTVLAIQATENGADVFGSVTALWRAQMTMDDTFNIYFNDTGTRINSQDDGHLDITADISVDINAPLFDIGTGKPVDDFWGTRNYVANSGPEDATGWGYGTGGSATGGFTATYKLFGAGSYYTTCNKASGWTDNYVKTPSFDSLPFFELGKYYTITIWVRSSVTANFNAYITGAYGMSISSGDTSVAAAIDRPNTPSASLNTGGSLPVDTYRIVVSALNAIGQTIASEYYEIATTSGNQTVDITWTAVTGADSYNVFAGRSSIGDAEWTNPKAYARKQNASAIVTNAYSWTAWTDLGMPNTVSTAEWKKLTGYGLAPTTYSPPGSSESIYVYPTGAYNGTFWCSSAKMEMGRASTGYIIGTDSHIFPIGDDSYNIGTSAKQYKDIYITGNAYIDGFGETTQFASTAGIRLAAAGTVEDQTSAIGTSQTDDFVIETKYLWHYGLGWALFTSGDLQAWLSGYGGIRLYVTGAERLHILGGGSNDMEVSSDILPSAASTYDLGSTDYEWTNLYLGTGRLYFYSDQGESIRSDGTNLIFSINTSDEFAISSTAFYPTTTRGLTLGSASYLWNGAYIGDAISVYRTAEYGGVAEFNKYWTAANNESPYFGFYKQITDGGALTRYAYLMGGQDGLQLVSESSTNIIFNAAGNEVIPAVTNDMSLGTSSYVWNEIYGKDIYATNKVTITNYLDSGNTDAATFQLRARDSGVGLVQIGAFVGAADPYLQLDHLRLTPIATGSLPATAVEGMLYWNTTTDKLVIYNGGWTDIGPGTGGTTDHGALTGLGDDDHTIYLLATGSRAVGGALVPDGASTRDLGSTSAEWNNIYIGTGRVYLYSDQYESIRSTGTTITFTVDNADELALSASALYPTTASGSALGSTTNEWSDAYIGNGRVYLYDDQAESIRSDGTNMIFGVGSADEVTLSATALYPSTAGGSALGSTTNEWSDVYIGTGRLYLYDDQAENIRSDGTNMIFAVSSGDELTLSTAALYPPDAVNNLGQTANRWLNIYGVSMVLSGSSVVDRTMIQVYNSNTTADMTPKTNILMDLYDHTTATQKSAAKIIAGKDAVGSSLFDGTLTFQTSVNDTLTTKMMIQDTEITVYDDIRPDVTSAYSLGSTTYRYLTTWSNTYFIKSNTTTDGYAYGMITEIVAGETLVWGDVVYVKSDGAVWLADADASTTMPAFGVALGSYAAAATATVLLFGFVTETDWTWTVGGMVYISTTAGDMTQTAPSGVGDQVQAFGIAMHADIVFINPSLTLVEV